MTLRLRCGALADTEDVTPCPDPYCRICRDSTGEVIERGWVTRDLFADQGQGRTG